jgi:hypothetical protein
MLRRGSAICFISSSAGLGWETNLAELSELLDTSDFDAAAHWFEEHGKVDYITTKQAICAYVAREACAARRGFGSARLPGPPTLRSLRPTRTCG